MREEEGKEDDVVAHPSFLSCEQPTLPSPPLFLPLYPPLCDGFTKRKSGRVGEGRGRGRGRGGGGGGVGCGRTQSLSFRLGHLKQIPDTSCPRRAAPAKDSKRITAAHHGIQVSPLMVYSLMGLKTPHWQISRALDFGLDLLDMGLDLGGGLGLRQRCPSERSFLWGWGHGGTCRGVISQRH